MPQLVRLYIRNVFYGAGLSAVFVGLLLGFNVANLRHLIFTSDIGYIALGLLFIFNTVVFSGVQFGIAVMGMAEKEPPRGGGKRDAIPARMALDMVPIPVPVERNTKRHYVKKPY
ncbi:hypothetical protein CKO11_13285 [Rhodobacter sp. TJ_12]|uniref:hypothetical protein n=1 Tax=Rhodobacter sp. TJ_12 TaxID=2029399 RepID=UPI001CBF198C|nr:hypothetical protein [Rhodobacter sp. TJ_12]MBZ4023430.1 hypothetical protein [Rhodobacter sp. TJ_12]